MLTPSDSCFFSIYACTCVKPLKGFGFELFDDLDEVGMPLAVVPGLNMCCSILRTRLRFSFFYLNSSCSVIADGDPSSIYLLIGT